MTSLEAVAKFVEKHTLHAPGEFKLEEANGLVYISPNVPSRGGAGYYVVLGATGDLINPGVFGSGVGYTTIIKYLEMSVSDPTILTILKENNLIVGNVEEDKYYASNPIWNISHRPNQKWLDATLNPTEEAKNE